MKNVYEIVEAGTQVSLEDEFGRVHYITVTKETVIIYANGYHKMWKIIIDAEDLKKVDEAIKGSWYVSVCKGTIYAKFCKQKNYEREYIFLHRLVNDCPDELVVDHHPHHYGLDNRRENLRNITLEDNSRNQLKAKYI